MAQPILLKRSSVIGKIPVTANLQYGELSINYADGALYYLTSNNTINSFVSNGSSFASNILTANLFLVTGNTTISSSITSLSRGVVEVSGNADGTYLTPNNNGVMLHITGQVNQPGRLYIDGQGTGAYSAIVGRSYNGNTAAPTGMLAGNTVFRLGSTPYHSTGWPSISTTRIDYIADEIQTATTLGSRMEFTYTPQGTAATKLGARIGSNGFFTYGNTVVANSTPSTSTSTGALVVAGGVGVAGNLNVGGNIVVQGTISSAVFPLILNDISMQFNAKKTVFALKNNQTAITSLIDSKDLSVVVDGRPLSPYITELRYPWITPYNGYRGFRVATRSGNAKVTTTNIPQYLVIYNAPDIGQQATVTQINISTSKQTRRYPYSATSIALGD